MYLIGLIVKSARNRLYYSFTHSWIQTPEPYEACLFHQANKSLWSSQSLWEMLYIFLCHPRQKQASDLERAAQQWLLLGR